MVCLPKIPLLYKGCHNVLRKVFNTPCTNLIEQKQKVIFFFLVLDILDDFWQIISVFQDLNYLFFIFLWITMIQFISLSFVLPRKVKKIKVSLLCSYCSIKCNRTMYINVQFWGILVTIKRGHSWPFQRGIFLFISDPIKF